MAGKEHYWYIRAWGKLLGSYIGYIVDQVDLARRENAPPTAIYRKDGVWVTFEEIGNVANKDRIARMVEVAIARDTTIEAGQHNDSETT